MALRPPPTQETIGYTSGYLTQVWHLWFQDLYKNQVSHSGLSDLDNDDHPQYHNDERALTWLGARSTDDLPVAGLDTQVQYNDNGAFGYDSNFTWDKVEQVLTITSLVVNDNITYPTAWKTILVDSLDDLPTPASDVITLEDKTKYILVNTIDLGVNQLSLGTDGEAFLTSINAFEHKLTSNVPVATPLFIGSIGRLNLVDIDIESGTIGQGILFDIDSSSQAIPFLFMERLRITGFADLGEIVGTRGSMRSVAFISNSAGLEITDTGILGSWALSGVSFAGQSGNFLTFTGTNGLIGLDQVVGAPAFGSAMFDFDASGVYQAVVVESSIFFPFLGGTFLAAGSADQSNVTFRFANNLNARDSTIKASSYVVGNSTATTISTVDTPVAVNATFTAGPLERFTHNTNGTLTYTGTEPVTIRVEGRANIEVNSNLEGSTISTYIYKNGSQEASTVSKYTIESVFQTPTSPEFVSVDNLELVTNDTLQMYIENNTDTEDITVTAAKLIV